MEKLNILVLAPIGDKLLRRIESVDPRIKAIDGLKLSGISNPYEQVEKDSAVGQKLNALLADIDIIFSFRTLPELVVRAPRLKWMQTLSAGVERVLTPDLVNSGVVLTNVRGMHAVQIGEMVFNMMLMHVKGADQNRRNQQAKKWGRYTPGLLAGKTLGIVGLGSIGRRLAYLGKAFGMRVVATRRSKGKTSARNVDVVYSGQQLDRLLAESDFVVDSLPSTPETIRLFGQKEFRRMKPSAFFVNIGRGTTVDEEDLIKALEEKWIAGAGLDTFAKEPLSPESPLWEIPGVIITPHIAGAAEDYQEKATEIFCENLKRYVSGQKLKNLVNKKLGY
jgi:D-2-hydroxyacid dehydrogenase (NADP+)